MLQDDHSSQENSLKFFFKNDENDEWFKAFIRDAVDNDKREYYNGILTVLHLYNERMEKLLDDTLTIRDLSKLIQINEHTTPLVVQHYVSKWLKKEHCVLPEWRYTSALCAELYRRLGNNAIPTLLSFICKDYSLSNQIALIVLEKPAWHSYISFDQINFLTQNLDLKNLQELKKNEIFLARLDKFFIRFNKEATLKINMQNANSIYKLVHNLEDKALAQWIMKHYDIPERLHLVKMHIAHQYHSDARPDTSYYKELYEKILSYEIDLGFSTYKNKNTMLLNINHNFMEDIINKHILTRPFIDPLTKPTGPKNDDMFNF